MQVDTERIYTIDDLREWPSCVDGWQPGSTALAVIGHPIAHSLSPVMHNAALAELAKVNPEFAKWRYFKFDIAPEKLGEALGLFHQKNFHGLNLTVPHKVLVMRHIDSPIPRVAAVGAANTLRRKANESGWDGFNTDGIGLAKALGEKLNTSLTGASVVLLGAGGAARAAAVQCMADRCASLWIGNRTQTSLNNLIADLQKSLPSPTRNLHGFSPQSPPPDLPADSVVINATSLGLKPDDESPIDLAKLPRPAKVFDMIYRPAETALLRQARKRQVDAANGLSMLVHQGAASLEIWTGQTAPVEIMENAAGTALSEVHSP